MTTGEFILAVLKNIAMVHRVMFFFFLCISVQSVQSCILFYRAKKSEGPL